MTAFRKVTVTLRNQQRIRRDNAPVGSPVVPGTLLTRLVTTMPSFGRPIIGGSVITRRGGFSDSGIRDLVLD